MLAVGKPCSLSVVEDAPLTSFSGGGGTWACAVNYKAVAVVVVGCRLGKKRSSRAREKGGISSLSPEVLAARER